ncbi:hypothetical protein [Methanorbis furvi]|uniref:Uncharacterized protein n=1 Tax=Methanorbis furvi TaxID=3028299 RepID=A0AAE4S8Q6_9EURY|nr:hypothetical protein [Methanocorpusculaceae archaeon Ag1]
MTGPHKIIFQSADGKAVRMHVASSAAVGTYLPVDKSAIPTASSPDSVIFGADTIMTDLIATTAAGEKGAFEVIADGNPTGRIFEVGQNYAANTARPKYTFPFVKGVQYRFRVVEAFAA